MRKLTRTWRGSSREMAHRWGITPANILLFSCLNALIWSEKCAVSNLCTPLSWRPFDNASHLVNPIGFAYCEAWAPGYWCVYSLQGGWSAACYRTIPGMINVYFERGNMWPARFNLTEKCTAGRLVLGLLPAGPSFFLLDSKEKSLW